MIKAPGSRQPGLDAAFPSWRTERHAYSIQKKKGLSKSVLTLIMPPRYTPDSIAVAEAAADAGWQVERLPSWRAPEYLRGLDLAVYGEPLFAAVVSKPLNLALLGPPPDWLPKLPAAYRKREVHLTNLGEARALGTPAFVKPPDEKCFKAGVYASGSDLPRRDVLPDETPVLVADVVRWQVEFRFFVRDRRILTFSPYLRRGELCRTEDGDWPSAEEETKVATDYARSVLEDPGVPMPPAFVMDVGLIEERGWAVLEGNAAWGSGIYGCDPRAVLVALEGSCRKREDIKPEEATWVVV